MRAVFEPLLATPGLRIIPSPDVVTNTLLRSLTVGEIVVKTAERRCLRLEEIRHGRGRQLMKQVLRRLVRSLLKKVLAPVLEELDRLSNRIRGIPDHPVDKGTQILLALNYQQVVRSGASLPSFKEVGFRSYSQNSEDGILLFIFALIGCTNRKVVEICAGNGIECNAANLIVNHNWRGLLFDGNAANIEMGRAFYFKHPNTFVQPPVLETAWITPDTINALIKDNGFSGEIDLLSLDLDGMDYWVWRAIECIQPRVVVLEHSSPWGADRAVTVPYRPDFVATFVDGSPEYCGASLPAFAKLAKSKGYRLVGVEPLGFNAFFVRDGLGETVLPEVPVESCFSQEPLSQAQQEKRAATLERLASREYIEV